MTWFINGKALEPSNLIVMAQDGDVATLTLKGVTSAHTGEVKCKVTKLGS